MEGYIGEVKMFAGTFAPVNWAFCMGQLIAISDYTSLYSILGTQYGGDGRVTFGLPDLRGRVPVGTGTGPGVTPRPQGQKGGQERVTLTQSNIPPHQHPMRASTSLGNTGTPSSGTTLARIDRHQEPNIYTTDSSNVNLQQTGDNTGGGQSVENMQPWLALNYIICLNGLYPPRS